MQHVFARADLRVQGDGGIVAEIGLHIDHVGAALRRDVPEFADHRAGDALPPVRPCHGQVVDVDLAALLLELGQHVGGDPADHLRSEEHTSELQSLMRLSYAVFCLKKKKKQYNI